MGGRVGSGGVGDGVGGFGSVGRLARYTRSLLACGRSGSPEGVRTALTPESSPRRVRYKATPPQMLPGWEEALETMQEGGTRVIQVRPAGMCVCTRRGACIEESPNPHAYMYTYPGAGARCP